MISIHITSIDNICITALVPAVVIGASAVFFIKAGGRYALAVGIQGIFSATKSTSEAIYFINIVDFSS